MDERGVIGKILQYLADTGSASVEACTRQLDRDLSAPDVRTALRSALEDHLIEATGIGATHRDLCYRLTRAGCEELARVRPLSRADILLVLVEFDPFGGSSPELVAWELGTSDDAIGPLWERLICDALIEPAGHDAATGEEPWRLTKFGHRQAKLAGKPEN
jgi:hypothetical protein